MCLLLLAFELSSERVPLHCHLLKSVCNRLRSRRRLGCALQWQVLRTKSSWSLPESWKGNRPYGQPDIFIHALVTGVTTRIDLDSMGLQEERGPLYPTISGDGRFVVYEDEYQAGNLTVQIFDSYIAPYLLE